MGKSRTELHQKLVTILGNDHVYFQPPESVKMVYPGIVYNLSDFYQRQADNKNYVVDKRYTVTYIHRDPDSTLYHQMFEEFEYCRFDRRFVNDNLYHDVYSIYY